MGVYNNITKYKEIIREGIFSNQNLLKYICCPSSDPIKELDIEDVWGIENKNIFFKTKNADYEGETSVFLHITFDRERNFRDKFFTTISINFDILIHNSLWDLGNAEERWVMIANEIDDILNGAKGVWFGGAVLKRDIEFYPNKEYTAKRIVYEITDLNVMLGKK